MKEKSTRANLIFRLMCFLLVVTSFSCIALAKYLSSTQNSANAEIGSLRCSINVNLDKSQTTVPFFNSQYIINDNVMNIPQKVPFLVNNCNLNADGTYSKEFATVDLKYDLVFYIPKEFANIAALQLARRDKTTREYVAASQLYVLRDFIGNNKDFNENNTEPKQVKALGDFSENIEITKEDGTTENVPVDYGSLFYGDVTYDAEGKETRTPNDETFTLNASGSGEHHIKQWQSDKTTITIKEINVKDENRVATLSYVFPTYDKEINPDDKTDNVTRYAPLHVTKEVKNLGLYEIRISRQDFVLKGGERQDDDYHLRITTIRDLASGENTCQYTTCKDTCKNTNITCQDAIYGTPFNEFLAALPTNETEKSYSMEWEGVPCTLTSADGKMWSLGFPNGQPADANVVIPDTMYVGTFIQKAYPVRINAIFTQTKIV